MDRGHRPEVEQWGCARSRARSWFSWLAATAGAAPAATQIAALNAQRAAHGIPAGIVEMPAWSEGCRKHMSYIAANGGRLTHEESPASPGYSADGAEVGRRAVITPLADAFTASANAFESAPLHLMQTLAPALSRMGVWGGCATTNLGYDRRASTARLYTYPGDRAGGFYAAEQASELPATPGSFVGLAQGTTTGPHLLVMALGTGPGRIVAATLAGPSGLVDVRTVDNVTAGLEGYMPPGGMIIPAQPLAPATTYTATATFMPNGARLPLARVWSFTTAGSAAPVVGSSAAGGAYPTTLRIGNARRAGRSVRFDLVASPSLVGERARVTIYRVVRSCAGGTCRDRQKGRKVVSTIGRLAARQTIFAPRPGRGRAIVVLVQTRAFARAGLAYAASTAVGRWAGS